MMTQHHSSVVDSTYHQIKKMILIKELRAGQRLSEIGLAEQLLVSRTPVREALRRLSNDGFVYLVPNSGVWVASPTKKEVVDAYAVRSRLESWSISMAVSNVTSLFLARLEDTIETERAVFKDRDIERYLEVNSLFHLTIAEAAGNAVLCSYVADILSKTFIYMVFFERFFDFANNPSLDEHCRILEALRQRNEQRCIALTEEHVSLALVDLGIV